MDDLSAEFTMSDYIADSFTLSPPARMPDNIAKARKLEPPVVLTQDEQIRNTVLQRLSADPYFKGFDIEVESKRCIVVLKGQLGNYDQIACAYRHAVTVPGVKAVYNGLVCNYH
ncbi:BON domain-containing protein [Methylovorus mays]|uniref:BON domain-containing protein n=1 Tax=Methylovorus mays TaxID=184077 RepID=UPI001E53581E|nr:BON domain-containing protein [Methylovorus mays]MCB5206574.1 BON domain-containing protein [Methylovorus mays]